MLASVPVDDLAKAVPLPPDIINDEEQYEIENILNHRRRRSGKTYEYLITWTGYGPEENMWLPEKELKSNANNMLQNYKQLHHLA